MNVLFVLHGDLTSNSGQHVSALGGELMALDCDCATVLDGDPALGASDVPFRAYSFAQAARFHDGRGPDIIHAWTPREKIRRLATELREGWPHGRLVVHLEDNEEILLQTALQTSVRALGAMTDAQLDKIVPDHLSHPRRYQAFLKAADGVTLLIDRLGDFVGPETPRCVFWPAADRAKFYPRPQNPALRESLGIAPDHAILVYTGNVHPGNRREVRSLYLAVVLLNREGRKVTLIRTGTDHCPLFEDGAWFAQHVIALGQAPRESLPDLLGLADVLVQPGAPDAPVIANTSGRAPSQLRALIAVTAALAPLRAGRRTPPRERAAR